MKPLLGVFAGALLLFAAACSDNTHARPADTGASAGAGAPAPSVQPTAPGTATHGPTPAAALPTAGNLDPTAAKAGGDPAYSGANALAQARELAGTIGPRVAGGPGEAAAAEYIAGQLAADGYTVETMPFTYDGDRFRAATLTAGGQTFQGLTMSGSAGGKVTAEAVYVGLADQAGIAGRSLAGKIAVADRGVLKFGEKSANAEAAGAAGLIIINNEDTPFLGNLARYEAFPVIGANMADGDALRAAAKAGESMTIDAPVSARSEAVDVIARPAQDAACNVVVGGHHDTVPGAPGAHDNASGASTVLELARAFAADGLDQGLCFATFGAEESGLYGSKALVQRLQDAHALPKYMINLDMTGQGAKVDLIGTPEVTGKALTAAEGLNIPAEVVELGQNFGSDHQSFEAAGVPVILITTDDLGQFHTPQDTVDKLQQDELQRTGDVAYALVKQLLAEVARG